MGDTYYGRDTFNVRDQGNVTVNNRGDDRVDVAAAVAELRALIAELGREGAVAPDGSVADPGAVVAAVQEQPGRLRALGAAVAGGAKDAVLSIVQGGVASLIVALVSRATG
ncbi:hypothetical protein FDA94_20475 [Herbidospora galbida]|uniref:Uncharacterized protein n=1 Tax=Herbidospora galbida TaxID=2575442 RepID=A0A4U3MFW5_9ACTN|nr:hypothetical protein [Herbidospora galbida]TKK86837.1 hypothetical protein FDA94_20475 [Herbidospora galbida]